MKRFDGLKRAMLAAASVIAGGLILAGAVISFPADGFIRTSERPSTYDGLREYVLMALAQPEFAGPSLSRQILGDVRLELYDVQGRMVYFSYPENALPPGRNEAVSRIMIDPKSVEQAPERKGWFHFTDYKLARTPERGSFFRTPVENLKIDSQQVLSFPFKGVTYTLTVSEMVDFMTNRTIYGGHIRTYSGERRNGRYVVFANHGAFVTKPGEPSLLRLTDTLLRDIDPLDREKRIQRLLDLVTEEVAYDFEDARSGRETLKKADEVLMTRRADCSNKVILFASMLEQIGEDYLLVYTPTHIAVAVEQGAFPQRNDHWFDWEGRRWMIAETTAGGFRIGYDRLVNDFDGSHIQFVQRPSEPNRIVALNSGREVQFQ